MTEDEQHSLEESTPVTPAEDRETATGSPSADDSRPASEETGAPDTDNSAVDAISPPGMDDDQTTGVTDRAATNTLAAEAVNAETADRLATAARTATEYRRAIVQPIQGSGAPSEEAGADSESAVGSDERGASEAGDGVGLPPSLAGRIIDAAGAYAGKYDPPVALSTHILNAVVTGLNAYAYDTVVRSGGDPSEEEAALLAGALALHDANKYVDAAYDPADLDTSENSSEVIEYYFDHGDDFGVKPLVQSVTDAAWEADLADIKWLVQRTETQEPGRDSYASTPRVRGLEKYCRIGDGFVSRLAHEELSAAAEWLSKFFTDAGEDGEDGALSSHVHTLSFTQLEQSVLNNHLLTLVKQAIEGSSEALSTRPHGVLVGSTADSVVYFGAPIDREALRSTVQEAVMHRITAEHEFSAKTEWNSFKYDILAEVSIPFEQKRRIIADGYAAELRAGSGTDHEFEAVPDEFRDVLPELAKAAFRDQNYEETFSEYPALRDLWQFVDESDAYSVYSRKMGFLAEGLRRFTGATTDGIDVGTDEFREEAAAFSSDHREALRAAMEPDVDGGAEATARFFDGAMATETTIPSADAACFLCGRPAEREYQKASDAFYQVHGHSNRVPAEGEYKHICPVCNLEHALLRDIVEDTGYGVDSDIKIAFVYYNEFVGNLTVGGAGDASQYIRQACAAVTGGENEDLPDTVSAGALAASFAPQYHLQPFYVGDENRRLRTVRDFLRDVASRGFKIMIGKPFAGFRPDGAILVDLESTRRQTGFGADRVASYAALDRVTRLFRILTEAASAEDLRNDREMLSIQQDGFHQLTSYVVRNTEPQYDVRDLTHRHFIDHSHPDHDRYMQMRDVAQAGLDLYGHEYSSRHKKVKPFRLAVDAILDALTHGKDRDELIEHASGQVYKTAQEDVEWTVKTHEAEAFVERIVEFLEAEGSLTKEALSKRRSALANSYLFAYDRLMTEAHTDSADDGDGGEREDDGATA